MPRSEERKARILVADDDAGIRDVLHELLCERHDCETARSAEEALALMVARAREVAPETVMIVVSGSHSIDGAVGALRAGAFDYITKPFDLEQVELAVGRALEHQELLVSKRRYETGLQQLIEERTAELDAALESLDAAYRQTLKALVSALEARDHETRGHS